MVEILWVNFNNIRIDTDIVNHIKFSGESLFWLCGEVSTQNYRYWSDCNPRSLRDGYN